MDILIHYLTLLGEFVGSGVGVWAITEAAKKIESIPLKEGDVTKIRAVAGGLSVLATLLVDWSNGSLDPTQLQNVVVSVIGVAVSWLVAHQTHKALN